MSYLWRKDLQSWQTSQYTNQIKWQLKSFPGKSFSNFLKNRAGAEEHLKTLFEIPVEIVYFCLQKKILNFVKKHRNKDCQWLLLKQGVCQIFHTEFPDFSLTLPWLFPSFPWLSINILYWNVSKFWYFFFNLLFLKKDFLISLKFPNFSLTFH